MAFNVKPPRATLTGISPLQINIIRYKGYTEAVMGLHKLGFIDPNPHPLLHPNGPDITWRQFMCSVVGKPHDILVENLKDALLDRLGGKTENLQVRVGKE